MMAKERIKLRDELICDDDLPASPSPEDNNEISVRNCPNTLLTTITRPFSKNWDFYKRTLCCLVSDFHSLYLEAPDIAGPKAVACVAYK
jgi:hypothetical protein